MYFQFFSSVLDSNRLNTTKYGIKKAKIPLKRPQNARKTLSTYEDPPPYPQNVDKNYVFLPLPKPLSID